MAVNDLFVSDTSITSNEVIARLNSYVQLSAVSSQSLLGTFVFGTPNSGNNGQLIIALNPMVGAAPGLVINGTSTLNNIMTIQSGGQIDANVTGARITARTQGTGIGSGGSGDSSSLWNDIATTRFVHKVIQDYYPRLWNKSVTQSNFSTWKTDPNNGSKNGDVYVFASEIDN